MLFFLFSLFCFFLNIQLVINRFQVPEFEIIAYVTTIYTGDGSPSMNINITCALFSMSILTLNFQKEGASDVNVHWRTFIIIFYPFRRSWRIFGSFSFFFFAFFHSFFALLRFFAPEIKIYSRADWKKLLEHFEKIKKKFENAKPELFEVKGIKVHFYNKKYMIFFFVFFFWTWDQEQYGWKFWWLLLCSGTIDSKAHTEIIWPIYRRKSR